MFAAALGGLLLLVAPPAQAGSPSVGVIAVSGDPVAAGDLQRALEERLRSEHALVLSGALDLASRLATPPAPGDWLGNAAAQGQARTLLAETQSAYYAEHRPEATRKLEELAKLLDGLTDVPAAVKVKLSLWRAAIHSKEGRKAEAEQETRVALSLLPDLAVGEEFPPAVGDLVATVRARSPRPILVHLAGLPPGSAVRLDGVVVGGPTFAVVAGPHKVEVVHPGLRFAPLVVEVSAETTLGLRPPALDTPFGSAFEAAVGRPDLSPGEKAPLDAALARSGLDTLVIAVAKGDQARVRIWRKGDLSGPRVSRPFAKSEAAAMGDWVVASLAASPAAPAATPPPTPPPRLAPTPEPPAIASEERHPRGGGGAVGPGKVAWACFAGAALALSAAGYEQLYAVPKDAGYRGQAPGDPGNTYGKAISQANLLTGIDVGAAVLLGAAGAWEIRRAHLDASLRPAPGGASLAVTLEF